MGRVGIDLYPNELQAPLRAVRTFTRYVGGFGGQRRDGAREAGVRAAIVPRGRRGSWGVRADFLEREGVAPLPRGGPLLADPTDVLRVLAAGPLPAHLLSQADGAGLAARPATSTPTRSLSASLYATGTGLAQSPSRETTLEALRSHRGRRSSTSTGGRACGPAGRVSAACGEGGGRRRRRRRQRGGGRRGGAGAAAGPPRAQARGRGSRVTTGTRRPTCRSTRSRSSTAWARATRSPPRSARRSCAACRSSRASAAARSPARSSLRSSLVPRRCRRSTKLEAAL